MAGVEDRALAKSGGDCLGRFQVDVAISHQFHVLANSRIFLNIYVTGGNDRARADDVAGDLDAAINIDG